MSHLLANHSGTTALPHRCSPLSVAPSFVCHLLCCAHPVSQATEAAAIIEAAAAAEEVAEAEAADAVAASMALPAAEGVSMVGSGYGGGPQAWIKLRQLLRCAEPYCHPSNSGGWSSFIGYLLQALCQFTSWRGETA